MTYSSTGTFPVLGSRTRAGAGAIMVREHTIAVLSLGASPLTKKKLNIWKSFPPFFSFWRETTNSKRELLVCQGGSHAPGGWIALFLVKRGNSYCISNYWNQSCNHWNQSGIQAVTGGIWTSKGGHRQTFWVLHRWELI